MGKPLAAVKAKDVEQYLLDIVHQDRSPGTRNVSLAAIRFALRACLRRDPCKEIRAAKVKRRSPEILSGSEVSRLLDATTSLKYRAIFMPAYGAGLRVGELVSLQTTDIDSERMLLHVRKSKTGPRYVMMSRQPVSIWPGGRPPTYARRRPELTTLHKVVRENLATLYAATEAGFDGTPLPRFVRQELDGYVGCGSLNRGFAHLRCDGCSDSRRITGAADDDENRAGVEVNADGEMGEMGEAPASQRRDRGERQTRRDSDEPSGIEDLLNSPIARTIGKAVTRGLMGAIFGPARRPRRHRTPGLW